MYSVEFYITKCYHTTHTNYDNYVLLAWLYMYLISMKCLVSPNILKYTYYTIAVNNTDLCSYLLQLVLCIHSSRLL